MLTVYIGVAMLVLAAVAGALPRLAQLRIRHAWLVWAALADQIVVISIFPDADPTVLALAHMLSYVAAGTCLLINRRLSGSFLIGVGGTLNGLAIALNGGTMPASAAAVHASGQVGRPEQFNNSAVLADPHVPLLGDILATPAWLPGGNVFSIGDIAVWLGLAWFLWRTGRVRDEGKPVPRHARPSARYGARHRVPARRRVGFRAPLAGAGAFAAARRG